MLRRRGSDCRVGGIVENPTCIGWVLESAVAIFAPILTPWVLYFPVLLVLVVAYEKDTMIKTSSAVTCWNNASEVELHGSGIYSNWNRLEVIRGCKLSCILLHLSEARHLGDSFALVVVASPISCFIRVITLTFNKVGLQVLISRFHESSIASFIALRTRAIYELLFWERGEFIPSELVGTFNSTCGWESPAWATLALIFNRGDCSLSSPVNSSLQVWSVKVHGRGCICIWLVASVEFLELLGIEISEFIHGHGVGGIVTCIVLADLVIVSFPNIEAIIEFSIGASRSRLEGSAGPSGCECQMPTTSWPAARALRSACKSERGSRSKRS